MLTEFPNSPITKTHGTKMRCTTCRTSATSASENIFAVPMPSTGIAVDVDVAASVVMPVTLLVCAVLVVAGAAAAAAQLPLQGAGGGCWALVFLDSRYRLQFRSQCRFQLHFG